MNKREFISVSKNMVTEYVNVFGDEEIKKKDVSVVAFHETPEHHRILLSVPTSDDFYYEVTYDKSKSEIHSYAYRKVGKRILGKKVNK